MGKVRIANVFARAGLHLGVTTVRRMLKHPPAEPIIPIACSETSGRTVVARYPHHVWNIDLTTVPIASGFWAPWFPFALPQCWPFCWWILVIVDHFSRAAIGFALFPRQPSAEQVCTALHRAATQVGRAPKYTVSDQGVQFRHDYRQWCARRGVKPRFGAVGRYGSVALIERFIRTMKQEGTRRILVPFRFDKMRAELSRFFRWYNLFRPHTHLRGATPAEVLMRRRPANRKPRLEPRARYPATGACAVPRVKARATGCQLTLVPGTFEGARHLPVVRLRKAA
jgi:transposase InsO family protein